MTQLTPELQKQIEDEARDKYRGRPDNYFPSNHKLIEGYIAGAIEYAVYKEKYERLLAEYESCFKDALKSSRAFTDEEIEKHWDKIIKSF